MTWKRSKDGGLDYDVSQEIKKKESFNIYSTAYTTTMNFNDAPLPPPKSRKEEIRDKIMAIKRAKIH